MRHHAPAASRKRAEGGSILFPSQFRIQVLQSYKKLRRALPGLCLFALSGCMVGPNYHRPKLVLPATYKEAAGWLPAHPAAASPKGAWWTAFGDPLLDKME